MITWRKSSYSAQNGQCVEIAWRKSSRSAGQGQCVEVASTLAAIRDSKNPVGAVLRANLPTLVTAIRSDLWIAT
jgi:hypothetical protein